VRKYKILLGLCHRTFRALPQKKCIYSTVKIAKQQQEKLILTFKNLIDLAICTTERGIQSSKLAKATLNTSISSLSSSFLLINYYG